MPDVVAPTAPPSLPIAPAADGAAVASRFDGPPLARRWAALAAGVPAVAVLLLAWAAVAVTVQRDLDIAARSTLATADALFGRVVEDIVQARAAALDGCGADAEVLARITNRSLQTERLLAEPPPGCGTGAAPPGAAEHAAATLRLRAEPGERGRVVLEHAIAGGWTVQAQLDPRQVTERLVHPAGGGGLVELRFDDAGTPLAMRSFGRVGPRPAGPSAGISSTRFPVTAVATAPYGTLARTHAPLAIAALLAALAAGACGGLAAHLGWRRHHALEARVERGLARGEFVPWVQPLVDLRSGRWIGGEVLARWQDPLHGLRGPAAFMPVIERCGLGAALTERLFREVATHWPNERDGRGEASMSFNFVGEQLLEPGFATALDRLRAGSALTASQVTVEVAERDLAHPGVAQALRRVQDAGYRIAIDGFGLGMLGLGRLEALPVDAVKVDRAFVATVGRDSIGEAVLEAMVAIAGRLGVPALAAGVECAAQREHLMRRGVRFGQGFHYARPMPLAEFVDELARRQPPADPTRPMPEAEPGEVIPG